jgi:endonuclease/exonuclease/phosphatase family metal-dependent hydrolase
MREKKKRNPFVRGLIWVLRIVGILVLCFAMLLVYLTVTEFRPADEEQLEVASTGNEKTLKENSSISIMTWNVGYGALGDNADFFMDGGTSVQTADTARVNQNLDGIASEIKKISPDFTFLQEVDTDSSRSHHINEVTSLKDSLSSTALTASTFAYNFRVAFIPYPIPPIGKVNGGILTLSDYAIDASTRYQLPCPFSWPVRLGNLKRCLMVDRVSVLDSNGKDTGKDLVLVNLHLEAYDSGEGKAAQTKMLNDILQQEADAGNYVIAGGDFNQTFSGTDDSMYPELAGMWHCGEIEQSDFSSDWQFEMDNSTPTCRSLDQAYTGADQKNFQYYMIDGFIVSKNISVDSVKTQSLSFANSDHNPVLMKVKLGS